MTPWIVVLQAPLSMGFSSQEYWSGWPFPSPGDLPDPGIEPVFLASLALVGRFGFFFFLNTVSLGKPVPFRPSDLCESLDPSVPRRHCSGCSMGGLL